VERARDSQAPQHAAEAMREAELARLDLEEELTKQQQAWLKSYDRARELALETKASAERATSEAIAVRDEAERVRVNLETRRMVARTESLDAVVEPPVKIKDVAPVYPEIAKVANVEGTVTIQAHIDKTGYVTGTSVIQSVPLLNQAALDAVKEWQYRPQTVNGKAVPSVVTVNVKFVRS
jgi:protein TonB